MSDPAKRSRIHLTGASGCGVTTIGRALATRLALPVHDTDDYYWLPTDIPYTQKRLIPDRLRLIREIFLTRPGWVLSGSLDGWGDPLVPYFDLVVFVSAPTELRLARLRKREARRFGDDAVVEGGWRHEEAEAFFEWASHYEDSSREGRNRARHKAWLASLPCPVLRLDGSRRIEESVEAIAGY